MKTKEKYPSTWGDAVMFIGIVLIVCIVGITQSSFPKSLLYPGILSVLVAVVASVTAVLNTYLMIVDQHILINSGYRSFGKDRVDIRHIRYICRQSTFVWKSSGSTMVIYLMGEDGRLHYTALKEANWKDEVLKHFLQRLLEIKPAIEIDPEYKYFLEGKYDETGGLRGNSSAGTAQTIGVFLKARGEKLEDRSLVRKFFEKFM